MPRPPVSLILLLLFGAPGPAQGPEHWWSLRRLQPPASPTELDAFVRARLRREGLSPSPEADRRTLIRRATFDLHGLPPTPEEIAAYVADARPDAFERLVDRLLASPRYGERWARHWLDVAHYGDTHGYDKDKVRPHAWPYRDWVVKALNDDVPWAKFVQMQVAGDVLWPDDPDGIVATGFIVAGPWDYVGHVELREGTVDKKITRNLDRDDMVTTTMSAFTSLTVHCARCHDHKFDPITQREYYGLQAVFAGVERADRPFEPRAAAQERRRLEARREKLREEAETLKPKIVETDEVVRAQRARDAAVESLKTVPVPRAKSPTNGWHSAIMPGPDHAKWVTVDLGAAVTIDEIVLWPARPVDFRDTPGFGFPSRYEVSVSAREDGGGARVLVGATDVANPGDQPVRIAGDGKPVRVIRVAASRLWKRYDDWVMALAELEALADGKNVARGRVVRSKDSIESGRWGRAHLVDGFTSRHPVAGAAGGFRRRRAAEARVLQTERDLEGACDRAERTEFPELVVRRERNRRQQDDVAARLLALPAPRHVFAAASTFGREGTFTPAPGGRPRPVHVLNRGDVSSPAGAATPGALAGIDGWPGTFGGDHPSEGERRAALARWLVHRDNPLPWRSVVNRVWHHHFGRGLVATPNDFGKMGARPSHPELLEWLAAGFRDGGGSLKALHKQILTSATWRQASTHDAARAAKDAGNRLLWRMNRRRLEAEAVRDAVLCAAGTLDLRMGGPGYRAFGFQDDHSPHYRYDRYDPDDRATWRRAIYRFQVRSVPDPFLETLDCADPSRSTPVRSETVTALQALSLLNNPFMLLQARQLAERARREATTTPGQVARVFQVALGRAPDAAESARLVSYVRTHGLPALCRLVFNLNEFLFVD